MSTGARRPAGGAERLRSLDAFRGITIVGMILVNNPGTWNAVYQPLQHAPGDGCTLADLVFPFFLFIVGVAVALSLGGRVDRGADGQRVWMHIVRRSLLIFALGLILNGFPRFDWSELRIPGVLQRVAVCYFCAAVMVRTLTVRGQVASAVALLGGYWAVMRLVPISGQPLGSLLPGANLAAHIDRTLLSGHLLHGDWDPEGLLSTLPAIASTLAGVLTGHWLTSAKPGADRVLGLFLAGIVGVAAGGVLNVWCPINKSLWTSSYVVFTSGMALIVLGFCFWLIDLNGQGRWATPFVIYGTNPIVAYVLSSLSAKAMLLWRVTAPDGSRINLQHYLFETVFLRWARPLDASLLYAVAYVLLWLGITAALYQRRVIIKI